jgi:isocitrate dehydrogenase kinase/phosphatase
VAFPAHRFEEALLAELPALPPSVIEEDGDDLVHRATSTSSAA